MATALEEELVPCEICSAQISFDQWSEHSKQCRRVQSRPKKTRKRSDPEETPEPNIPCEYCDAKLSSEEWESHSTACSNSHKRRVEKLRSGTDGSGDDEESANTSIPCEYCGEQISLKLFEAHVRECGNAPRQTTTNQMLDNEVHDIIDALIPCEYCNELITVLDLATHTEKCAEQDRKRVEEIMKLVEEDPEFNSIPCQYCDKSFPLKEIEKHQNQCQRQLYSGAAQSNAFNGVSFNGAHAFPDTWEFSSPYNLSQYVLEPNSDEYKFVADKFHETLPNNNISQIERIQNRRWYRQYDAHRDDFIERYGRSTEVWLFHGCKNGSTEAIMKDCFNRSHAVRCAAGQGIYFAAHANISLGYTSPGPQNERHMFMARVLVGQTTGGDQTTRVCPRGYDTTGGNGIYVTYHDAQAYGEYLITFQ